MSRFKKRSVSILLVLSVLVTFVCSYGGVTAVANDTPAPAISSGTYGLAQNIQDGVILHAWNWSYKTIEDNMADIAAAGYSAVQTSPVQQPRDYNASWTQVSTQWWKYYQPLDLTFATEHTWMGTPAEFQAMCTTAHSYGVKVIVDIVANHLANDRDGAGNARDNRNSGIPAYLRNNDSYWHVNTIWASDGNRYDMTMGSTGQPDLNTGNSAVQGFIINLMKTCIDKGADGFRFDAAKHIEVPEDPYGAGSSFWPNVTSQVSSYGSSKGKNIYYYGEVLNTAATALSNYTEYISLTDNQTGNNVKTNVLNGNAAGAAASGYVFNLGADKTVLWAESHDIFAENQFISNTDIMLTWAIVASRADATSLFLARPWSYTGNEMGQAGDTSWKGANVAAVNKFHNYFVGQGEYLSNSGSVVINERGTTGAVLVNLSGGSVSVNAQANRMIDGTYKDQISGNNFTVSNGRITGSITGKNIAVLYNTAASPGGTKTLYLQDKLGWGSSAKAYCWNTLTGAKNANWPGVTMTYVKTTPDTHENIYKITFPDSAYDYIIFTNGSGSQTVDLPTVTNGSVYYCTQAASSGKYKVSTYPST